MKSDKDRRRQSTTLTVLQERSQDSPSRQLRSMSVAYPEIQVPTINHPGKNRPRTNSLPNPAYLLGFSGPRDPRTCCVSVRSFTTTPKGVINAGDIVRKSSINSLMSTGSAFPSDEAAAKPKVGPSTGTFVFSTGDNKPPRIAEDRERAFSTTSTDSSSSSGSHHNHQHYHNQHYHNQPITGLPGSISLGGGNQGAAFAGAGLSYYRVVIQGDEGVGKTALTRQFSSSEYMGTYDTSASAVDSELSGSTVVPVMLDGEESIMEFIDQAEAYQLDDMNVDAYIVVFSLVDKNSYTVASDLAHQLRVNVGTDRVIMLVGNKSDIVRNRHVDIEDARMVATMYDCKYVETSAALNHRVDELVSGTLALIRQQLLPPGQQNLLPPPPARARSRTPSPVSFFNKIFRRNSKAASSSKDIFIQ